MCENGQSAQLKIIPKWKAVSVFAELTLGDIHIVTEKLDSLHNIFII